MEGEDPAHCHEGGLLIPSELTRQIPDVPLRVLAATQHDVYRKPQTGMYDFVVALYEKKGWKIGESTQGIGRCRQ